MDFEPSDDQRLLLESVSRMLADNYSFAQRKTYIAAPAGWSGAIWSQFAELGLLGLPFPEQYGGYGGGPQETMLVMQAFGRVLVVEPYLPTVILGGTAILAAGTDAQKQALLPAIAEGKLKLAFAHGERQARYDLTVVVTTAKKDGDAWVLDGSKTVVAHGDSADTLIVSARTSGDRYDRDGITLFLVDTNAQGVARRGYVTRTSDRKDARRALITLTEQGRQMHDAILAIARRRQRRLLAALPKGAADSLVASLDRLQAEADRMLAELDASEAPSGSATAAAASSPRSDTTGGGRRRRASVSA